MTQDGFKTNNSRFSWISVDTNVAKSKNFNLRICSNIWIYIEKITAYEYRLF